MPKQEALRQYKAKLFEALASPDRIAILELLLGGNTLSTRAIASRLEMPEDQVRQHLQLLQDRHIVRSHRSPGQQAEGLLFYSLVNTTISDALVMLRWYFEQHIEDSLAMLEEVSQDEATSESEHLKEVLSQLRSPANPEDNSPPTL
jgi:DNA-binding transcriptional ArsR family regulator